MSITIDPQVSAKIDAIDLTQAIQRLRDAKLGKGWTAKKARMVERKYRNFLKLIATGMRVVPTLSVDEMWHLHILDSRNYMRDCQNIFGKYIHHDPYGLSTSELTDGFAQTCQAYRDAFGEEFSK